MPCFVLMGDPVFSAEALRDLLPRSDPPEELPALQDQAGGSFPSKHLAAKTWPQTITPFPPGRQAPYCVSCSPAGAASPGKQRDEQLLHPTTTTCCSTNLPGS